MPLYFAVVLVVWPFYPWASKYFLLSLLFLANFAYAFGAGVPHGPGVFWSLAIEEHFYLVWPWLVRYLSRRALTVAAIGIVVAVPALRFWGLAAGMNPRLQIYNYSFFRFDGLALGALMAIWVRSAWANRRTTLWLSAALMGASVAVTLGGIPFGVMSQTSPLRYTQAQLVFAAFLVAAVALKGTAVTAPLRWKFAKLSGDLSYCIYLVHLSVADAYHYLLQAMGIDPLATFGPLGLLVVRATALLGCTFGIALLSRRFLEQPMLRLKRYFEYGGARPHASRAGAPN
jgi:peptidoglycan/LPS O-acetylase OafA/YrhL